MNFYRHLLLPVVLAILCGEQARADSGTLRASEQSSKYRISVFTDPTRLRVGVADISVLIQDASNEDAIATLPTQVIITSANAATGEIRAMATSSAATNKLFVAAIVNLPVPGAYHIEVICGDGADEHRVQFEATVEPPLPHWLSLWPWFSWPAVVVAAWFAFGWRAREHSHGSATHSRGIR